MQKEEIVLRDEKEIICVLCQGADDKTRVTKDTTNVCFYAYAVPGIEKDHLKIGLSVAAETVARLFIRAEDPRSNVTCGLPHVYPP